MRPKSAPVSPRLRRRRRILGAVPTVLASWAVLSGLPFGAPTPRAGKMHTEIVTLTGASAEPTAPARSTTRALRTPPAKAQAGWTASLPVDAGTQAVGLSWLGASTGALQVRGHGADGWGPWSDLHAVPGEGPDHDTRDGADLVWFGRVGVDRIEVEVEVGTLSDLEVQTMRYEEPSGGVGLTTAVAGAADTRPTIQPRSLWTSKGWATENSGCASGPTAASGGVKFAVVHHTVNANTYAAGDVPAMLASIYEFHTGSRGWCDIAYNFIVDRFGRIWEGRSGGVGAAIIGGHAAGFNTNSVGVSFLGQYEPGASPAAASPTSAALQSAGRVIGWKLGLNGLDPTSKVTVVSASGSSSARYPAGTSASINRVSGHRDVGYTECPGHNLYSSLATIRATAKSTQAMTTPTIPRATTTTSTSTTGPVGSWGPFATPAALVNQQYRDILHRSPTSTEVTYWVTALKGSTSPTRFIAALVESSEADGKANAVIRLYRAYFLRNPDHGGFSYWLDQRLNGWTLSRISDQFASSSEFRNRYGRLSSAGFVDLVYRNVIGRAPDASGRSYWIGRLGAGVPRGQVMTGFSESSEYRRKTRYGVAVIALHEALLQKAPLQGTYDYLEPRLRSGVTDVSGVAKYFFDKPEYRARFS